MSGARRIGLRTPSRGPAVAGWAVLLGLVGAMAGCGTGIYEDFAGYLYEVRHGYYPGHGDYVEVVDDDFFSFGFSFFDWFGSSFVGDPYLDGYYGGYYDDGYYDDYYDDWEDDDADWWNDDWDD